MLSTFHVPATAVTRIDSGAWPSDTRPATAASVSIGAAGQRPPGQRALEVATRGELVEVAVTRGGERLAELRAVAVGGVDQRGRSPGGGHQREGGRGGQRQRGLPPESSRQGVSPSMD